MAALLAPQTSLVYFTEILWDTSRIGQTGYVSNQSLMGLMARLDLVGPHRLGWVLSCCVIAAGWVVRVRSAVRLGDDSLGFAMTGLRAAC